MLDKILKFSLKNKLIVILFTFTITAFGLFAVLKIPVGAVPDITNNQVQVITTSVNLSTQEIEQFITAPVEMEMANLPGVSEIRSVSKFGLSVVTIVFRDNMGTYLPRQLIAERIKSASENIPEGFGTPEMGPISTGLGEIYQYTIDVKPGYDDLYTPMDLRTIQDWIVRRRLSGINGVVEINSWGGYLKEYEIAIDPARLRSVNLTLRDVFDAIASNNSISGGAYIEKTNQSYFIRGDGQVKSLDDIENIVVNNRNGVPVLIKDISDVRYGYANRFGAITANGKGETVLGQIMMLKNANSKEVINEVKKRIEEIQKNLPEGVYINPVLERSELIAKTSLTVIENLIFGALIVFLIVFLILGNLRSAGVIASMIPLALLFTISMMYIFGIDANLMSLGALDFGIIIDGAVIIVEYIALRIMTRRDELAGVSGVAKQSLLDNISYEGSSKMMNSAIFGQIIILIVFIPILSLSGVEGKMFRPMALAFSFAILGAMIFGLTWLPVASSIFLKETTRKKDGISGWIMKIVHRSYEPVIKWSCGHKRIVLGAAIASLIITVILFTRIGGEFVPTLDEGDFVIQPVLKTGTSLSKTIETTTKMENILISEFTEVEQIVSRIGAAEVPTDPMSMEEIDMIIKLRPKEEWVSASTKEELAEKFKNALSVLPGLEYEFTQPIEMRFNELITGVRADIAIKIFGEDLDYINQKAIEIKNLISDIPGAGDVILEKTVGLPQVRIAYNREKIAYYGLNIKDMNNYLSTAFGGETAGTVFEGEKRFDMVVRLNRENRTDINNIKQLYVPLNNGNQIPLEEVADIRYSEGPAKISRENTHRRVVVSVNVRNRDLQSVVKDIRDIINSNVALESGNYIEYGGQFENLQNATKRLLIAVPVALLLIFIFLHFAFKSLKDALMIFTAIPLATVGGVILLWIRGMPFSVSAGVGFIALFGIAVLNGIVLIEHLKDLQHSGITDMKELILRGTRDRLRPVLLTAGAAAMGFLPMAVSTGAGAEVQRPLATVVIGGLVTSTMLTMIALPLLFEIFYNVTGFKFFPFRVIRSKPVILILLLIVPALSSFAQPKQLKLSEIIQIAITGNKEINAYSLKVNESKALKATAFDPGKTTFSYGYDQNNIAPGGYPLKVWGIEQEISFPTMYAAEMKARKIDVSKAGLLLESRIQNLKKEISLCYYNIQNLLAKNTLYKSIDSLYSRLLINSESRYKKGDISQLDLLNIEARKQQARLNLDGTAYSIRTQYQKLKTLMNFEEDFTVAPEIELMSHEEIYFESVPGVKLIRLQNEYSEALLKIERNRMLPDLSLNYFTGTNEYENSKYYNGFQVGLALPVFFGSQRSRIRSSRISLDARQLLTEYEINTLKNRAEDYLREQHRLMENIEYYNKSGRLLYDEILRTALISYQKGEIDLLKFTSSFESAVQLKFNYLENVLQYNTCILEQIYLTFQN
ncbi:MAG TPA: CusA/CzcA family heavy metal efflux RND transporter [Bacteroidales bacterium]|nr:CusA/CzcA family heavy metal efflux RND transporter [Bacteroidales bacterium]HPR13378.1 CusA/CzcA family heavy metal efflux RND transporter [Bacteroidales bacterium]HRW85145.1 CusA/CzcA family heavy metal efflux RND transporter [Bacteroidales bacterium]